MPTLAGCAGHVMPFRVRNLTEPRAQWPGQLDVYTGAGAAGAHDEREGPGGHYWPPWCSVTARWKADLSVPSSSCRLARAPCNACAWSNAGAAGNQQAARCWSHLNRGAFVAGCLNLELDGWLERVRNAVAAEKHLLVLEELPAPSASL